jgi:16S rRNA (uracil1498-N3)-methyltransferase
VQDLPRLYADPYADLYSDVPADALRAGAELPMTPAQAHYLGSVLRRQAGDRVSLFNQTDGEWSAEIVALRKERGTFRLDRLVRAPAAEPGPALLFAPLKRDPTDLVVRMATELGVASLHPVLTERSNTARINAGRWRAIAIEAAEQCERLSVPAIAEPVRLPDLLAGWDRTRPLLAALERSAQPDLRIAPAAWRATASPSVQPGLLVGPEGGFSPQERRLLESCGFVLPVRLGSLILRAETACLAGLASLQR